MRSENPHRFIREPKLHGLLGLSLCLSLLFSGGALTAQQSEDPRADRSYDRTFSLKTLDIRVAEAWYWDLCKDLAPEANCRVAQSTENGQPVLAVEGPSRVHAAFAHRLAESDVVRTTQDFVLLLVEASMSGAGIDPSLPAHAKAALEDVREFLPFSKFELLDTGLIKSSGRGQTDLSGPDGTRYDATIVFDTQVLLDRIQLSISPFELAARYATDEDPGTGQKRPIVRRLVSSSLTLGVGETAVVGTSKLNGGDKALIVLLTALE